MNRFQLPQLNASTASTKWEARYGGKFMAARAHYQRTQFLRRVVEIETATQFELTPRGHIRVRSGDERPPEEQKRPVACKRCPAGTLCHCRLLVVCCCDKCSDDSAKSVFAPRYVRDWPVGWFGMRLHVAERVSIAVALARLYKLPIPAGAEHRRLVVLPPLAPVSRARMALARLYLLLRRLRCIRFDLQQREVTGSLLIARRRKRSIIDKIDDRPLNASVSVNQLLPLILVTRLAVQKAWILEKFRRLRDVLARLPASERKLRSDLPRLERDSHETWRKGAAKRAAAAVERVCWVCNKWFRPAADGSHERCAGMSETRKQKAASKGKKPKSASELQL